MLDARIFFVRNFSLQGEYAHRENTAAALIVLLACMTSFCGCTFWQQGSSEAPRLPASRMSQDSVSIELTFVRLPPNESEVRQSIWAEADELCMQSSMRNHLNQNGIRCGVLGSQLPTRLRQLLDDSSRIEADTRQVDLLARASRQQWQKGKRVPIVVTDVKSELILLQYSNDDKGFVGQSFTEAQGFLAAKTYPQGDGRVRIVVVPEIHHGDVRRQWISGEGSYELQTGKQRDVLSELTVDTMLAPGQTLVLGCTSEQKGVGETLFVNTGNGDPQEKLMLLRISQVQRDELFDALTEE